MATDVQINASAFTCTGSSGTTAPAAGTSEAWNVSAVALPIRALTSWQSYTLVDATPGASAAQAAEVIRVTACTGAGATSITVTRGADGTTPVAHATGTVFNIVEVDSWLNVRSEWDTLADFGIIFDLRSAAELPASGTQVVMTSGSNVVNIPNAAAGGTGFTSTAIDAGKRITIQGAGASGAVLVGYIGVVNSTSQCTVLATPGGSALNASTTVTANATGPVVVWVQWGTDNTTANALMVSVLNASTYPCPKVKLSGGQSRLDWTNGWGIPAPMVFNKPIWVEGIGGGHNADAGDYTKIGGTRIAWWGTSSDGGVPFGAMITVQPSGTATQAIKRPRFSSCWFDGRNGDMNQPLFLLKLASTHGSMLDDGLFFMDALAVAMWFDVSSTLTAEAADNTRFDWERLCFRQLDNNLLSPPTTTPTTTSTAVTLSNATPQTLTIALTTGFNATGGYAWVMSTQGCPFLIKYTSVSGSTLAGCIVSTEDAVYTPATFANALIVPCTPGNGGAMKFSGSAGHNTCCGFIRSVQVSYGGTFGPAAVEVLNSDTVRIDTWFGNGGSNATLANGNRQQRPGIRLNGSIVSATLAARGWTINNMDPGGSPGGPLGGISAMGVLNTGAIMAFPTGPHYVDLQQMGNGAPVPTIEQGAYLDWNGNGMWREGGLAVLAATTVISAAGNVLLAVPVPPQGWQIGTVIEWLLDISKGAVGLTLGVGIRQNSAPTTGTGTLIANAAFTGTAVADAGRLRIRLGVTGPLGAACVSAAKYELHHNLVTTGLATGAITAGTLTSATATNGGLHVAGAMTNFNSAAPGSGPEFLFLDINTGSTALTVLAGASVSCIKPSA